MQKTALKNTKYSRNKTIFKIGHLPKAIAPAKAIFGSKIKNAKNMRKTIQQEHYSCSVQKSAPKNTKPSTNERIFKIGHFQKAIAFAKWSVWVKNLKCQKHAKNHSTRTLQLFSAKHRSKKHQISRNETSFKMGHFAKTIAHAKAITFAKW